MGIFPIRKKELKTYGSSDRPFEHWSSNISWRGVSFLLFLMSCLVVRYSVLCIALCSWHSGITIIMHCSTKAELEHQVLVSYEFFLKICSASSLWDLKTANWFISKTAGCKHNTNAGFWWSSSLCHKGFCWLPLVLGFWASAVCYYGPPECHRTKGNRAMWLPSSPAS